MNFNREEVVNNKALLIFVWAFVLVGCSSRSFRVEVVEGSDIHKLVMSLVKTENENLIIEKSLYTFLSYLKQEHSKDQWGKFKSDIVNNKGNLESLLQKNYRKTMYELGYEMGQEQVYPSAYQTSADTFNVDFVRV